MVEGLIVPLDNLTLIHAYSRQPRTVQILKPEQGQELCIVSFVSSISRNHFSRKYTALVTTITNAKFNNLTVIFVSFRGWPATVAPPRGWLAAVVPLGDWPTVVVPPRDWPVRWSNCFFFFFFFASRWFTTTITNTKSNNFTVTNS